jgi:hypothetical protein
MRHPLITAQLLRQARAAASIQTSTQTPPGVVSGRRVPRLVVWSAAILLVVALAALGIPLPAGTALAGAADERGQRVLELTLARERPADPTAADQAALAGQPTDAVERFRQGERASQEQPTDAVEQFRRGERASQEQPATTDNPTPTPAQLQPDQPTGQPGWLVVSLGVLAAVLALVAGLALVAARRATRRARVGQAT